MKIAIVGYGRMGRTLDALAEEMDLEVVARIDDQPLTLEALGGADVAIEFTTPSGAQQVVTDLLGLGVDVVSGTTGWDPSAVDDLVASSGRGFLHATNFSIGIALFRRIVREAARRFDPHGAYDLHLAESHHTGKVDHPSGTAITLAEDVLGEMLRKREWVEQPQHPAAEDILGISVERVGSVPGTHELSIDGPDDRITLRHEARSRDGFARGALHAARWLRGRAGVFTLDDLLTDMEAGR